MSIRMQIATMVFMMVQAVTFGFGIVYVLATPLREHAMIAIPAIVAVSTIVAAPLSWSIAPRLRARYWQRKGARSDAISGPGWA